MLEQQMFDLAQSKLSADERVRDFDDRRSRFNRGWVPERGATKASDGKSIGATCRHGRPCNLVRVPRLGMAAEPRHALASQ
jgi:hypothetical protein